MKIVQVPAIIYYERVDMINKLSYSDLPQDLDLSILRRDINISVYVITWILLMKQF